MKQKRKKIGQLFGQVLGVLLYVLLGVLCGLVLAREDRALVGSRARMLVLVLAAVYLSMFLQIVIHEAGHLVFGLLTGYRFVSYRVFGLMWIRQDGRLRFRRYSLAGTGGQCLLAPPDWREDLPYVLYNLGGVLMNLIAAALFALAALAAPPLLRVFLRIAAIIGLGFALMNGLPLRIGPVDNDGRNILSIRRSPAARRAFWLQMRAAAASAEGRRLRDMPEEWFSVPGDEDPENSIIAAVPVNRALRLMDARRFAEAAELQDRLCAREDLAGVYRGLLTADRITCELLGAGDPGRIEALLDKAQRQFMRAMRRSPSVLRTQIALCLLRDHDAAAAEKLRADFEKAAAAYPYPADIEGERELLALIAQRAAGC